MTTACPMIVVGAGPLGMMSALLLASDGVDVTLIGPRPRKDARTTAIMQRGIGMLTEIGVWETLEPKTAPLSTMRIVDGSHRLIRTPETTFHASEIGYDAFGHNVINADLNDILFDRVLNNSDINYVDATALAIQVNGHEPARVTCDNGTTYLSDILVGADGRQSKVRDAASIKATSWSYPQTAIVLNLEHTRDHDNVSTEFHTDTGPFTLVPLPGKRSSLVWMERPPYVSKLLSLSAEELGSIISEKSHYILGDVTVASEPMTYPMTGLRVEQAGRYNALLVGESAHVFPPIGAQGMNLGIRDALALRECVRAHRLSTSLPGEVNRLGEIYDRQRRVDINLRTTAVDTLNRSLLSGLLPVHLSRGLGLHFANISSSFRQLMMKQGLA